MGSSSMENSLISRLENLDYKGLQIAFSDYLQPFSDFIDFNNDVDSAKLLKNTKKNFKTTKKCSADDPKLLRSLAKQFLPFIFHALKVLPNKLSEPPKPGGGKEEQIARELFDIYRLCLDCLACISSCLDCKPFHIHFQRIRMVHCLEAWGRYGEVESVGFLIFESLWSINLVKGKKVEGQFIPDLTIENAEPDLACLIMEIVVCIVKCAIKSQSKDEAVYRRVLSLADQVRPWLRVLDSKAFERLHHVLVTNLYKCTIFMLGECFEGDLVHKFCMTSLTECLKSCTKDQFLKFAYNISSSLRSQWVSKPSLILDILQCVLESILCDCKVGVEYIVNEFLNLVHYCLKRCRIANRDTCRNIGRYLEKTAGELVQVAGPIDSILRLYATGFHFMDNDFQSRYNGFVNPDSSKNESAVTFLFGIGDKLQDLAGLLLSLESYFHIASNDYHPSSSCAEKNSRSVPSAASASEIECSSPCKNKHGKISLLSYLNAMEFFFHPFTELVNKTCIQIISDKEAASLSVKIKYIRMHFISSAICILLLPVVLIKKRTIGLMRAGKHC